MTTYSCKCGKTFQKNTEAGTTGFRMPDYGPGHECYGCPFVCRVMTWDPTTQENAVQNHECRGSKTIRYETEAALSLGDKCVGRIYSLDLDFLHHVRDYADTLDGIDPDRYAFSDRPTDYGDDGRLKLTIYPAQNNKGIAAKRQLFDMFFHSDGTRRDVTPEQEKEIVLNQIKEAKALAQGIEAPVETGRTYYHNGLVFFADQRKESEKFTVFVDDEDHPSPSTRTEVATIPDFDTFNEAQNALDGMALKRGFSTKRSTGGEKPEMEQQTNGDISEENGDAVPGPEDDLKMEVVDDATEQGNSSDNSGSPENENQPSDNDSGDSDNDGGEQPPQSCDWKNASGADQEEPGAEENDDADKVSGDPLSLRGPEFDAIATAADSVLNRLVAMLHEKKQRDGEMTIKITFEDAGGAGSYIFGGAVSGKINYTVKPQKIVGDAMELQFDAQGNPIVPADREHQLNFDEIQPGQREYPPSGGTATVDGKTGIVEDYQQDGEEPEDPPISDDVTNSVVGDDLDDGEESNELYPCKNTECPFYVYNGCNPDASGCDFGSDPAHGERDIFNVAEAVEQNGCTRPEVLQDYADAQPVEDEKNESEEQ